MHLLDWHPVWMAIVIITAWFYLRIKGSNTKEKINFTSGLIVLYAVIGTPFDTFAFNKMMTAMVVQLSILFFVVPPLLIRGIPSDWFRSLLRNRMKRTFKIMTYPWLTAVMFNFGLSVFLFPFFFNLLHEHRIVFGLCETFLFLTALMMWWSILSPLPELNPLSQLKRLFYIFITAVMLTPIAFLLLFTKQPLYPVFESTHNVFPYISAVYDQQIAGGVLKGFQLSAYSIELAIIIYEWVWKEKEERAATDSNKVVSINRNDDKGGSNDGKVNGRTD